MKEELFLNEDSNEIEISKYGKKKRTENKLKLKNIYISFLLLLFFLFIIIFIWKDSSIDFNFTKESNNKNGKDIQDDISEKDRLNEIALRTKLHPYPMVQYFLQRTKNSLVNIFRLAKFKKEDIDVNRFKNALNKTIYNHPTLLSRYHKDENGEIFVEYRPDIPPEIKIINIKDEDIPKLGENLLHIYEPFDSQMVNFTIYVSETSVYFYYDIFHSNFDGNSGAIFENNLEQAYLGKPLKKDYFF